MNRRDAAHELALQLETMLEAVTSGRYGLVGGKPGRTDIREYIAKALIAYADASPCRIEYDREKGRADYLQNLLEEIAQFLGVPLSSTHDELLENVKRRQQMGVNVATDRDRLADIVKAVTRVPSSVVNGEQIMQAKDVWAALGIDGPVHTASEPHFFKLHGVTIRVEKSELASFAQYKCDVIEQQSARFDAIVAALKVGYTYNTLTAEILKIIRRPLWSGHCDVCDKDFDPNRTTAAIHGWGQCKERRQHLEYTRPAVDGRPAQYYASGLTAHTDRRKP